MTIFDSKAHPQRTLGGGTLANQHNRENFDQWLNIFGGAIRGSVKAYSAPLEVNPYGGRKRLVIHGVNLTKSEPVISLLSNSTASSAKTSALARAAVNECIATRPTNDMCGIIVLNVSMAAGFGKKDIVVIAGPVAKRLDVATLTMPDGTVLLSKIVQMGKFAPEYQVRYFAVDKQDHTTTLLSAILKPTFATAPN